MSEDTAGHDEGAAGATAEPSSAQPGKGTRIGATLVLTLIAVSLVWYFAADRLTPHSSQAYKHNSASWNVRLTEPRATFTH